MTTMCQSPYPWPDGRPKPVGGDAPKVGEIWRGKLTELIDLRGVRAQVTDYDFGRFQMMREGDGRTYWESIETVMEYFERDPSQSFRVRSAESFLAMRRQDGETDDSDEGNSTTDEP